MKDLPKFVLILACAVSAGAALASPPPGFWIDVPFVAQTKDGCGSASISMVMQYWAAKSGTAAPPSAEADQVQRALFSRAQGGIPASAMRRYLAEAGYRVFAFPGTWEDLRHHVERGRPLIVSLGASGPLEPFHYVVVVGIDSGRNLLFVNDPAGQKMLRISREGFESEWNPTHNWTLLAVPLSAD